MEKKNRQDKQTFTSKLVGGGRSASWAVCSFKIRRWLSSIILSSTGLERCTCLALFDSFGLKVQSGSKGTLIALAFSNFLTEFGKRSKKVPVTIFAEPALIFGMKLQLLLSSIELAK